MQTQEKKFSIAQILLFSKNTVTLPFTSNLFVSQCISKCTAFTRISAAARINFFLQKCGAYLRAQLNTIEIPLSTVSTQISAAALINPLVALI